MTRKEFLAKIGLGTGVIILAPVIFNSCEGDDDPKPDSDDNGSDDNGDSSDDVDFTIDLTNDDYSDLQQEGGYVYKNNIIIAYLGDDEYIALSELCTHQQCSVEYNLNQNQLICPCHGSVFSTSGSVVEGPADKPLKEYNTELDDNMLRIYE